MVKLSPDGSWAASSGLKNVKLWNGDNGEIKELWTLPPVADDFWHTMNISADSKVFFFASYKGQIRLWDLIYGQVLAEFQVPNISNLEIALSWDNTLLVLASSSWNKRQATLWDLAKNEPLRKFELEEERTQDFQCVAILPNNSAIALSSYISLNVYSSSGSLLHSLLDEEGMVFHEALEFSADGKLIACGDTKITIWSAETGQKVKGITCEKSVEWISFTDEDRSLLTSEGKFPIASTPANDTVTYELFLRKTIFMYRQKKVFALNPEFLNFIPSIRGGKVAMVFQPNRVGIRGLDLNVGHVI